MAGRSAWAGAGCFQLPLARGTASVQVFIVVHATTAQDETYRCYEPKGL